MLIIKRMSIWPELTLSATLAQQGRPTCWLLATPHNRALIRCKPNPSLVSDTTVGDIGRDLVRVLPLPIILGLAHAERLATADILEHPLTDHRLGNGVYHTSRLHTTHRVLSFAIPTFRRLCTMRGPFLDIAPVTRSCDIIKRHWRRVI